VWQTAIQPSFHSKYRASKRHAGKNPSAARAPPRTPLESLQCSPRPRSWWEGAGCPLPKTPPALVPSIGSSGLASPVPTPKLVPTPLSLTQQLSILVNLLNLQTRPKWRCSCHRLVCWHRKPSFICRINCRILKDGERSGSLSGHRSKL